MEQFLILGAQMIPFILIIGGLYFFMIRPQKKKDKATQLMRNNMAVGDEVITIGGVVGIVVSMKEDTLVLETGGDRSKIRVKRWAIQSVETIHEDTSSAV